MLAQLEQLLPGHGSAARALRRVPQPLRHPARAARRHVQGGHRGVPPPHARAHQLPAGESFTVEYVTGKSWSGYNWYQGNYRSLIQVNTDLPIYADRAIDLACHEGYPGHHVYNVLLEKNLVRDRGWLEFSGLPAVLAAVAHRRRHRQLRHRRRVSARRAADVRARGDLPGGRPRPGGRRALLRRAGARRSPVLRRQRGGAPLPQRRRSTPRRRPRGWSATACIRRPRAEQRVRFIDQYRSYVINYNLGKDMVARYIEARSARATRRGAGRRSRELLSSPRLPSGLAVAGDGR